MAAVGFDTLKFARRLEEAGVHSAVHFRETGVDTGVLLRKSRIEVILRDQCVHVEQECFRHDFRLGFCLLLRDARCH